MLRPWLGCADRTQASNRGAQPLLVIPGAVVILLLLLVTPGAAAAAAATLVLVLAVAMLEMVVAECK